MPFLTDREEKQAGDSLDAACEESRQRHAAEVIGQLKEQAVTVREMEFAVFCEHIGCYDYEDEESLIDAATPRTTTPIDKWSFAKEHKLQWDAWLACFEHHVGDDLDATERETR